MRGKELFTALLDDAEKLAAGKISPHKNYKEQSNFYQQISILVSHTHKFLGPINTDNEALWDERRAQVDYLLHALKTACVEGIYDDTHLYCRARMIVSDATRGKWWQIFSQYNDFLDGLKKIVKKIPPAQLHLTTLLQYKAIKEKYERLERLGWDEFLKATKKLKIPGVDSTLSNKENQNMMKAIRAGLQEHYNKQLNEVKNTYSTSVSMFHKQLDLMQKESAVLRQQVLESQLAMEEYLTNSAAFSTTIKTVQIEKQEMQQKLQQEIDELREENQKLVQLSENAIQHLGRAEAVIRILQTKNPALYKQINDSIPPVQGLEIANGNASYTSKSDVEYVGKKGFVAAESKKRSSPVLLDKIEEEKFEEISLS